MVLTALRHPLSEADIRNRRGHTSLGMQLNRIANGLNDVDVPVQYHIEWSFDDLVNAVQHHAFPIAGIDLRPVEGIFSFHAVVVANITADHVFVHDPRYEAGPRSVGLLTFRTAREAAEREAVIITAGSTWP